MKKSKSLYHGHRFHAGVVSCAVRCYFRFQLSLRDIEELLFERGVIVTYETIRCWCDEFGAGFARQVKAVYMLSRGHRLARKRTITFANLVGESVISIGATTMLGKLIDEAA